MTALKYTGLAALTLITAFAFIERGAVRAIVKGYWRLPSAPSLSPYGSSPFRSRRFAHQSTIAGEK